MATMKEWVESLDKNIISAVIPTYNRSNFLGPCLKSLAKCERHDLLDVIIVDDGSDSYHSEINAQLFREFLHSKVFNQIRLIKLDVNSKTVCIPRNIGISYAAGRSIAPTDDDCLPKSKKFEMIDLLWAKDSNVIVFGDREEFHADINGDFHYYRTVPCGSYTTHKKDVGIDNGQFIYKADNYIYASPKFPINACDWETYSSFADNGEFIHVARPVCKYLWHATNISRTAKPYRVNPLTNLSYYFQYFKEGPFKDACKSVLDIKGN